MEHAIAVIVGLLIGAGVALAIAAWLGHRARQQADRLLAETQQQRAAELAALLEQVRTQFAALSREALSANAGDFLKLAETRLTQQAVSGAEQLETKRKLIDAHLETLDKRVGELGQFLQRTEAQRHDAHGQLRSQLEQAGQVTQRLQQSTEHLRQALANPQRRGHWGERIAEDVLRLAGFVEGASYVKQETTVDGSRPDFTFPLPNNQRVNLDVKFPLAAYLRVLDASDDAARATASREFLRDVRTRIREVTTRDYIDPAAGTVDYVLVFIPNEQVYAFIHESDPQLLDDALRQRVVLCSPLTLYAVLAVMRQVAANFRVQQASYEILGLLGEFRKQWDKYVEVMDRLGKRLDDATKAYSELSSTRTRQLERQLDKIEALREARTPETPDAAQP